MKKSTKTYQVLSTIIFVVLVCVIGVAMFNKGKSTSQNLNEPEGVKILVVKEGTGEEVKVGDTISVNYVGSFENGEVFESNAGEDPFAVELSSPPVIRGWSMGVSGMKVGEKRIIEINPEYAYGEKGVPGVVPPFAKLVYDVELVAINN